MGPHVPDQLCQNILQKGQGKQKKGHEIESPSEKVGYYSIKQPTNGGNVFCQPSPV